MKVTETVYKLIIQSVNMLALVPAISNKQRVGNRRDASSKKWHY